MGLWLSGRAFALHVKGPGFDPRLLHFLRFYSIHTVNEIKLPHIY